MPLEIDPCKAKNLYQLFSNKTYPIQLAKRLWCKKGQSKPNRTPDFRLVTVSTALVERMGSERLVVTWYGFRSLSNSRLPQFYVCELSNGEAANLDLYSIGAVGNSFEVDILLTDSKARPLKKGLWEALNCSTTSKKVTLNKVGFYEAKEARWSEKIGRCENLMSLRCTKRCLLWVVSYRHSKHGWRNNDPFKIPVSDIAPRQDGDGSPGDGEPGGEGGP